MTALLAEFWLEFSKPENLVGHIAYTLLILSMMMRNMNLLRLFAIMAGSISVVYYVTLGDMVSMFWEGMFTLVNLAQFLILKIENRRGKFSEEEAMFIATCLPNVERAHARKLVRLGAWTEVQDDIILIQQDTCPANLKFIVDGSADVYRDGRVIGKVGPGDFLGEMSYLTKKDATASVITTEAVRYLAFERNRLREHLDKNHEVRHALESSFNRNLVDKLVKSNANSNPTDGEPSTA